MSTAPADNRTKDALTLIRERTSVNHFDPSKTVSEAEIREIISDAVQAPSSYNIQHWRFVAVTDPEKKKQLEELQKQLNQNGSQFVLDLTELTLVDLDVIRFLGTCEASGIKLVNCSPYVREWMNQEGKM